MWDLPPFLIQINHSGNQPNSKGAKFTKFARVANIITINLRFTSLHKKPLIPSIPSTTAEIQLQRDE
jgi:hypothetical protein